MMRSGWGRRGFLRALAGGGVVAAGLAGCAHAVDRERERMAQAIGLEVSREHLRRARALLARQPAVDLHAHPGRFILEGTESWHPSVAPLVREGPYVERTVAAMREGGVAAVCFAAVGDMRTLGFNDQGGIDVVRDFGPGEAWRDYRRQIRAFERQLAELELVPVLSPADVSNAHRQGRVGAIVTVEGADFLEGRLERLDQVYADGVRSITIVHYRPNGVGGVQTGEAAQHGLSDFGAELVRAMNRRGMIVDLAHADFETTREVVSLTRAPVMLSHSHLGPAGAHPRLISAAHARLVAGTGGIIGAWPAGIAQRSLADYLTEIERLVDTVGIDHVGIGTDMDINYQPVLDDYRHVPLVAAGLLARGMREADAGKILGGNFLRVFEAVRARAA